MVRLQSLSTSLIKISLLILSIFLPFSISGISISVSLLFLGYVILCVGNRKIVLPADIGIRRVVYLMLIFILIMTISLIFSVDKISAVKRTVTVAGYFLVFINLLVCEDKNFVKKCLEILIFFCILHSVYAIIQFYTGIDIVNKGYQKYSRIIGIVGHFNSLAGILGLIFVVVASFFYLVKEKRFLNLVKSAVLLYAIILTFTRGIWLGILAAFLIIGVFLNRKFAFFVLLFLIVIFLIPQTKKRVFSTFKPGDQIARIYFLKETPKLILNRLVLGYGPDSFRKVFYEHYPEFFEKGHFHPHNMYLHILFELGVLGFMSFLLLFYEILRQLSKAYNNLSQTYTKALVLGSIGSVIVFLVYGLVDEPFRAHFAPYCLFFLLGVSFRFIEDNYGSDVQK